MFCHYLRQVPNIQVRYDFDDKIHILIQIRKIIMSKNINFFKQMLFSSLLNDSTVKVIFKLHNKLNYKYCTHISKYIYEH